MSPQDRKAKAQAAAKSTAKGANAIVIGGLVVVLAIVVVVGGVIWSSTQGGGGSANKVPQGVEKGEPFEPYATANPGKEAPVVDVYEDFRCPACKGFEEQAGPTITELAKDGKIRLRVHLKTLIDGITGGDSSAVSASSALCAADQGKWTEYHDELFALQPAQETEAGFPKSALTEAAKQAGLEGKALDEWQQCTDDGTYVEYVQSVEDASAKAGIKGTPTVEVEGKTLNVQAALESQRLEQILTSGTVPQGMVATQ